MALCAQGASEMYDCRLVVLGGRNVSSCHDDLWVGEISMDQSTPGTYVPVVTWRLLQDDVSSRTGGAKRFEAQAVFMRLPKKSLTVKDLVLSCLALIRSCLVLSENKGREENRKGEKKGGGGLRRREKDRERESQNDK